ncbi:hypothetical protein NQ317_004194 [Molorchus minor]|uniref:DUF1758 domain-containing protein n=1 Tax=Molorchus minor TaxID=1323400 RepID=A0ABQ9JC11_9CUCU|nr:hypothetical protein NQ317_004194 [Molorchus minor]
MSQANKLKQLIALRLTDIERISELKIVAENALVDREIHPHFKMRYKQMESIFADFKKQHINIVAIIATQEDASLEEQSIIRTGFDNNYFHIQGIYSKLFDEKLFNTQTERQSHVKLPKLEIAKFGGDVKTWKTFIDMFDSMIHENPGLSNVEKFNYLIHSLKGTPLSLVKCTPLTSDNYFIAYSSLKSRYDDTRLIATSHWHEIENSKSIPPNDNNAQLLRSLLNTFVENIAALENLGYPVKHWDFILFNMLISRLDNTLATRFELDCNTLLIQDGSRPYQILVDYLNKQCQALDTVNFSKVKRVKTPATAPQQVYSTMRPSSSVLLNTRADKNKQCCSLCKNSHLIYSCPQFLTKTPQERFSLVKTNRWCINCLGFRHNTLNCSSTSTCRKCQRKHHTLLHFENNVSEAADANASPVQQNTNNLLPQDHVSDPCSSAQAQISTLTNVVPVKNTTILLSTVQIDVQDTYGNFQRVRALLDSASQANFITNKCCNRLGLTRTPLSLSIRGLGQMSSTATHGVSCKVKSREQTQTFTLEFAVVPQICSNMPSINISLDNFTQFSHLNLADPDFNISGPIDMLLGADLFGFILKDGSQIQSLAEPAALNTIFGYVIMGRVNCPSSHTVTTCLSSVNPLDFSLENAVKAFWELEQVPQKICIRDEAGRYTVALPFREFVPTLENSRDVALRRFYYLERRLDIFYDDVLSGGQSVSEALTLQSQLIKILHKGGFELRKWASNHEGLLSHLPTSLLHAELLCLDFNADLPIKVLGLKWHPSLDICWVFGQTVYKTYNSFRVGTHFRPASAGPHPFNPLRQAATSTAMVPRYCLG